MHKKTWENTSWFFWLPNGKYQPAGDTRKEEEKKDGLLNLRQQFSHKKNNKNFINNYVLLF